MVQPNWPALIVLITLAIFWFPFVPFLIACFSWLMSFIEPVIEFIFGVSLILALPTLFAIVAMLLGGAIPRTDE
jgi:hypothetical protein